MKRSGFIKYKLKLIYTSPLAYFMLALQVSFLIIYICANKITTVSDYTHIFKTDFFLWIIFIPLLVVQHKVSVYSTYYNCLSRIHCRKRMVIVDFLSLAISTCISACIVLSIPLCFFIIKTKTFAGQELFASFFFLSIRYILLGLLVQYIIYSIMYAFPKLQQKGGSICLFPFLLFFAFTAPMEFLSAKGDYIPVLDFSAGKNYSFIVDDIVLWDSIIFYNIHLIGYLIFYTWLTIDCLSKKWEFLENESVSTL